MASDNLFPTHPEVQSVHLTWPGPLSIDFLRRAYDEGWTLERWTPERAVFVRGDWSEVVLKPAQEALHG